MNGDLHLTGSGKFRAVDAYFASGYHNAGNFDPSTGRRLATSLIVPRLIEHRLADGVDVAAFDIVLAGFIHNAELIAVQFIPEVIRTVDKTFTIDIHKGDASNNYATVLSATILANGSSVTRTPQLATVDPTKKDFAAGSSMKLIGTVGAGSGDNFRGGVITVLVYEHGAA
jgi:hypothetical protein